MGWLTHRRPAVIELNCKHQNLSAQDSQSPGLHGFCFPDDWQVFRFYRAFLSYVIFSLHFQLGEWTPPLTLPDIHSSCCLFSHCCDTGRRDLFWFTVQGYSPSWQENHGIGARRGCSYFIHSQEAKRNECKLSTSVFPFYSVQDPIPLKVAAIFTVGLPFSVEPHGNSLSGIVKMWLLSDCKSSKVDH